MPWVNLDDQMPEHPKVWSLTEGAFRLHIAGICYCNRHLTNGSIDADRLSTLVPRYRRQSLTELLDRGLWMPSAGGEVYEIHDFLQWNRSREQVRAEKERQSKGGKRGAQKRWGSP